MPHCQAARRTNPAAQRAFKERLGLQAPDNLGRLGTWTLGFLQHSRYTSFKRTQRIPVAHSWSLNIIKFLIILASAEAPQKRGLKFDWLGAEFNRYSHYSHAPHMLLTFSRSSRHHHSTVTMLRFVMACHGTKDGIRRLCGMKGWKDENRMRIGPDRIQGMSHESQKRLWRRMSRQDGAPSREEKRLDGDRRSSQVFKWRLKDEGWRLR